MTADHRRIAFRHHDRKCVGCGASEDLHVHHRDEDQTNNDPSNLAPLCESCHRAVHHLSAVVDGDQLKFELFKTQGRYHLTGCGMADSGETFLMDIFDETEEAEYARKYICGNCKSRMKKFGQWPKERESLSDVLAEVEDITAYDCLECGSGEILTNARYSYGNRVRCAECGGWQSVVDLVRGQTEADTDA